MSKFEDTCATWIFELFAIMIIACGIGIIGLIAYFILGQNF